MSKLTPAQEFSPTTLDSSILEDLQGFSPYTEENVGLPDTLRVEPPDQNNTEAVRAYQQAFKDEFGIMPQPIRLSVRADQDNDEEARFEERQVWGFKHFFEHEGDAIVTTHPALYLRFLELGVSAFDEFRPEPGQPELEVVSKKVDSSSTSKWLEICKISSDGIVQYELKQDSRYELASEQSYDELDSIPDSHFLSGDGMRATFGQLCYRLNQWLESFNAIEDEALRARVLQYVDDIGMEVLGANTVRFPTPLGFLSRLDERAEKGRYVPNYIPVGFGEIKAPIFCAIAAADGIGFSTVNPARFGHDVASAHEVAYEKYREALTNMLMAFNTEGVNPTYGVTRGKNIDQIKTKTHDDLTDGLGQLECGITTSNGGLDNEEVIGRCLGTIASAFNAYGIKRLQSVLVIKSALERHQLEPGGLLAADILLSELKYLAGTVSDMEASVDQMDAN